MMSVAMVPQGSSLRTAEQVEKTKELLEVPGMDKLLRRFLVTCHEKDVERKRKKRVTGISAIKMEG